MGRYADCHGAKLQGQPSWRQRDGEGNLPAPPHDETGHTWHHRDELLFEMTKRGIAEMVGGNYKTRMPAYGGILSDEEILSSLTFIKASWPEHIRLRHDRMSRSSAGN